MPSSPSHRRRYAGLVIALTVGLTWLIGPGAGSALASGAPPVCHNMSYTVANNATLALPISDACTDPEGDTVSVALPVDSLPQHGSLSQDCCGGGFYQPNPGYVGPDSFTDHAITNVDGQTSNQITISITVTAAPQPTPGCLTNQPATQAFEGMANSVTVPCFQGFPGNTSGLSVIVVSDPHHGTLAFPPNATTGTYTADDEYVGADSFDAKVTNGTNESITVTVPINVVDFPEGNQAPVCPDSHAFVTTGDSVVLQGNCVDPDGDPITYSPTQLPVHGTYDVLTCCSVRYHPNPGYTGPDSFGYNARDPFHPPINNVTVAITVLPVGAPCCESAPQATPAEPFAASVASPNPGPVYIDTRATTTPDPGGFNLLDFEYAITAPDATAVADPLRFVFKLDASALAAAGVTPASVRMFRNGSAVNPSCPPVAGRTDNSWWPCEESRQVQPDGDLWVTVLTMAGSTWNAGVSTTPPDADHDGVPDATDNCVNVANANQKDYDQNGHGDACDPPTPSGVCRLTKTFVSGSAKYAHLSTAQKKATDKLATALCDVVDEWTARLKPAQKAAIVAVYKVGVVALEAGGWVTHAQAVTLKDAAGSL